MVRIAVDGAAGPAGSGAWPFVVTRNRVLDSRPVVAPDWMIAQGGEYLLVHAADPGDGLTHSPLFERIVTSERYGDLTLLARSRRATADLIGGSAQEQLLDRVGRPIQLIEGLVLLGRHPGCAVRWQAQLARVDAITHQSFPDFWRSDDESEPPAPSQALTEAGPTTGHEIDPGQDTPGEGTSDSGAPRHPVGTHGSGTPPRRQVMTAAVVIAGLALLYVLIRITRR